MPHELKKAIEAVINKYWGSPMCRAIATLDPNLEDAVSHLTSLYDEVKDKL